MQPVNHLKMKKAHFLACHVPLFKKTAPFLLTHLALFKLSGSFISLNFIESIFHYLFFKKIQQVFVGMIIKQFSMYSLMNLKVE